jgi:hypothetical protein
VGERENLNQDNGRGKRRVRKTENFFKKIGRARGTLRVRENLKIGRGRGRVGEKKGEEE